VNAFTFFGAVFFAPFSRIEVAVTRGVAFPKSGLNSGLNGRFSPSRQA
jgi:hypothetical protein